jgi:hypothetical protein
MSKDTIIDTEYATLWYHPEPKVVHHKFHKYIYGEEFRQVLEKGLEVFIQHNAQKWLSDDRLNSALPPEDAEWGINNWSPRVMGAGWKYWALVMPDKIVGQMNMQRFIDLYAKQGVTVQIFDDPDEALKWLGNP